MILRLWNTFNSVLGNFTRNLPPLCLTMMPYLYTIRTIVDSGRIDPDMHDE